MRKNTEIICRFTACVLLLFFSLLTIFNIPQTKVYAVGINFDKTDVLTDLQSIDENITTKYPYTTSVTTKIQIIQFVEYGYSQSEALNQNYGLYIYVYNPTKIQIVKNTQSNLVEMASGYDTNPITAESKPTSYDTFNLQFCSVSTGEFADLYYKFKIVDKIGTDGKAIKQRVNPEFRRYDISGIELLENGKRLAEDYGFGGTYSFTGYAKGFDANNPNTDSTLQGEKTDLETLRLSVEHTYYRTETSVNGTGWQNQIDTVFFSVPDEFFDKYGRLQKIKAEWYEFVTNDITVFDNEEIYNRVKLSVEDVENSRPIMLFDRSEELWGYSREEYAQYFKDSLGFEITNEYYDLYLYYYFLCEDIDKYDPYANNYVNGTITGSDLENWIYSESAKHRAIYENAYRLIEEDTTLTAEEKAEQVETIQNLYNLTTINIQDGLQSTLFEYDIQSDRIVSNEYGTIQSGRNGKSFYEFDVDIDKQTWLTWNDVEHDFWENAYNWGFFNTLFGNLPTDTGKSIEPIKVLSSSDFLGSQESICESLVINYNDVPNILDLYEEATRKNERVVLFRFAVTDYFSTDLHANTDETVYMKEYIGYRAQETVFLDFNVISLTFNKDSVLTVIPVVADPINIINDITPPYELPEMDLLKIILAILALIVFLMILMPLLPTLFSLLITLLKWIIKIAWFVITLPFKVIRFVFKRE